MMNRRRLEAVIFVWPLGSAVLLKSRFARYFESLLLFDMKVTTQFRTLLHIRVASSNASRWQTSSQNHHHDRLAILVIIRGCRSPQPGRDLRELF